MFKNIHFNIHKAWTHTEIRQSRLQHFQWVIVALLVFLITAIPLLIVLSQHNYALLGNKYTSPVMTLYIRFSWAIIFISLVTAICHASMILPYRKIRLNDHGYRHLTQYLKSYQSKQYPHSLQEHIQLAINYVTHCYATRNYITHNEVVAIKKLIETRYRVLLGDE